MMVKLDKDAILQFLKKNWLKIIITLVLINYYIETVERIIHLYRYEELDQKDMYDFTYGAKLLLDGINPYTQTDLWTRHHPPGLFYLYALLIMIFGDSYEALKIPTYIFALGTAIIVFDLTRYLIKDYKARGKHRTSNRMHSGKMGGPDMDPLKEPVKVKVTEGYYGFLPWISTLFYLMDRAVQDRYSEGSYEAFTTFFFFLGFYFFFKGKDIAAAVFWAISIIIQLVAFFLWPMLLLYFLKTKDWKRLVIYFWVIFLIIFFSFLPFLIDDFSATLHSFLLLTVRYTTNYSFFWYYSGSKFEKIMYQSTPLGSVWFIIQVVSYFLIVYLTVYRTKPTKHNLIMAIFIMYMSLPILTNSYGIRYLNWLAPVFYTYSVIQNKKLQIGLFFAMGYYCIHLFKYFWLYPWLMVVGAYVFSLSLIVLFSINFDKKKKPKD